MKIFVVQAGGWCGASKDVNGYKKYGKTGGCQNGVGGGYTNDVYGILHPILHGGMSSSIEIHEGFSVSHLVSYY